MKSKVDFRLGQRILLAAALFSFTSTLFAAGPTVSNVRAAQRAGLFSDEGHGLSKESLRQQAVAELERIIYETPR